MTAASTRFIPGVTLCGLVTGLAMLLERLESRFIGQAYVEALVLAILLGVAIRSVWTPGRLWQPGIGMSAKLLLEIAVALLGASLSAGTMMELGPALIGGIAVVVVIAVAGSYVICRVLGLPQRMAILIACGNSICGNSAIAAVAPIIGAKSDDVASSIAFTAVLGVVVVLSLPLLVPLLHLSLTQYGVLAGLTVYAVPQVLAATLPIGALSNQVGTVVKLVRVLMLAPLVLALSLFAGRLSDDERHSPSPAQERKRDAPLRPGLHQLVPWFIIGFLVLAVVRNLGLIPEGWLSPVRMVAYLLTTIAMAALGLGVDVRIVARAGAQVTAAVTSSLAFLIIISFALIAVIGIL